MNGLVKLYSLVKANTFLTVDWTPEKGSWRWGSFWSLIIGYGFRFEKEDLKKLERYAEKHFRGCSLPEEGHYSQAVVVGNTSFAVAYETYHDRKPFFFKGIDYGLTTSGRYEGYRNGTGEKSQGRLILGARFQWEDERVAVTSFNDKTQTLIACAYQPGDEGQECDKCGGWIRYPDREGKIKKRFTITPQMLRETLKKNNADEKAQVHDEQG